MANAIVTLSIMPESPSVDLKKLEDAANKIIDRMHGPGDRKVEIEPIAFGLKKLKVTFVMDEKKGSPDPVAEEVAKVKGVQSATISDVRRAIG
ncbi:MAG: elongation factor 1-beta [Nanoarchaeota archaeon]